MVEMAKAAARSLDGSGTMTWRDQFGWKGESWNMFAGIIASGVDVVVKDEEDIPVYMGIGERGMLAFEKLLEVFGDRNISLRSEDVVGLAGDVWVEIMDPSFMDGRILFANTGMNRVTLFRGMNADFGIIPSPKADENQPRYSNTVSSSQATALCIPTTVTDLTRTGIIIDALCAESRYTLMPAYYYVQLKTKLARDEESAEMLDIIFESRKFDLSIIYGWGDLSGIFSSAMTANNPNIVSNLDRATNSINASITRTVAAIEAHDN
jgi:hypothetical protein